jgi:dienelactone hydrolase
MQKILFILLLAATSLAQDAAALTFSELPGPYAVGLRVVQQYDYTRIYRGKTNLMNGLPTVGERARPVQTLVWYPAKRGGAAVRYADYIRTAVTEDDFNIPEATVDQLSRDWVGRRWDGLTPALIERETKQPMSAVANATPSSGHFPVVIYAPSFGASAHENADLCEFLASQGYIVLASPSMGARARAMTHDLEGAEAQVADIGFLTAFARTLPQADMDKLAVVGYSWGGMANILAAAKDNRIGALVSLDGSVRYFPSLVKEAKYVTPTSVTVPLLYIAAQPSAIEEIIAYKQDISGSLLNQLKYNDWHRLTMQPMVHANFTSEYQRFALDTGWGFANYTRAETSLAYSWMARYVQRFLDATLKHDTSALSFIDNKPDANGVPAHWATMQHHRANGQAPTLESFAAALGKLGFDHAAEVYRDFEKRDAAFKLSEEDLRHWGYQLLMADHNQQAIGAFKLVTVLFPASSNAFDCLGEAYQQNKEIEPAIENYARSLELDASNDNAVQHLKVLRSMPATPQAKR